MITFDDAKLDYVSSTVGTGWDDGGGWAVDVFANEITVNTTPSVPATGAPFGTVATLTFDVIGAAPFEFVMEEGFSIGIVGGGTGTNVYGSHMTVTVGGTGGDVPDITGATAVSQVIAQGGGAVNVVFNLAGTNRDLAQASEFAINSLVNCSAGGGMSLNAAGTQLTVPINVSGNGATARTVSFNLTWNGNAIGSASLTQAGDMPTGALSVGIQNTSGPPPSRIGIPITLSTVPTGGLSTVALEFNIPSTTGGNITFDANPVSGLGNFSIANHTVTHSVDGATLRVLATAPVNVTTATEILTIWINQDAATAHGGNPNPSGTPTTGFYPLNLVRVVEAQQNPGSMDENNVLLTVAVQGGLQIDLDAVLIGDVNVNSELTSRDVTLIAFVMANPGSVPAGFGWAEANVGCTITTRPFVSTDLTLNHATNLARYLIGADARMCAQPTTCTVGSACNVGSTFW